MNILATFSYGLVTGLLFLTATPALAQEKIDDAGLIHLIMTVKQEEDETRNVNGSSISVPQFALIKAKRVEKKKGWAVEITEYLKISNEEELDSADLDTLLYSVGKRVAVAAQKNEDETIKVYSVIPVIKDAMNF